MQGTVFQGDAMDIVVNTRNAGGSMASVEPVRVVNCTSPSLCSILQAKRFSILSWTMSYEERDCHTVGRRKRQMFKSLDGLVAKTAYLCRYPIRGCLAASW